MNKKKDKDKFKIGDCVRIKNIPGPLMIVTSLEDMKEYGINCIWFDEHNVDYAGLYPASLLEKAKNE